MLPVNSCIPRCQRRAPELRVAIDSLEACRGGLLLHGFGLASAGCPLPGPTVFAPESARLGAPTSDARVALRCPDSQAGSSFGPMPLLLPPRERRRVPRHRTSSATKEPSSDPSDAPGVATRSVLSTPLHRWLPFFAVLLPLAESPWAPPAATGGACLDLTPLDDFCNHTEGRAHQANVRSSHEAPFLGRRSPSAPKDPGNRER